MKILVVGGGGREHALVWKLAQSPRVTTLYCAPGNAGIDALATCVPIPAEDVTGLKAFVTAEGIDLTVVGPEAPLTAGIADEFRKAKLRIFGPTKAAAQLEASKSFAKELLYRHGIPTARSKTFERVQPALAYLEDHPLPVVIKADGPAQGKGVVVAGSREDAREAVRAMLEAQAFGAAGQRIVIEEFLDGEEVTIMAFTDGKTVVPMIAAQDHKRVGDGDTGPNTGGMGAHAPAPVATATLRAVVQRDILVPVVEAMAKAGRPYQGLLYAGLMIVQGKPYVLEFNARFGDPETQVVLPLLDTDLLDVMEAVIEHRLDQLTVSWKAAAAVCVVLASGGYPGTSQQGLPIVGVPLQDPTRRVVVFHAGTKRVGDRLVTAGGRVMGVTGIGPDFQEARAAAYRVAQGITFDGCHFRTDIGHRAMATTRPGSA